MMPRAGAYLVRRALKQVPPVGRVVQGEGSSVPKPGSWEGQRHRQPVVVVVPHSLDVLIQALGQRADGRRRRLDEHGFVHLRSAPLAARSMVDAVHGTTMLKLVEAHKAAWGLALAHGQEASVPGYKHDYPAAKLLIC